jgi:hypothetical protein
MQRRYAAFIQPRELREPYGRRLRRTPCQRTVVFIARNLCGTFSLDPVVVDPVDLPLNLAQRILGLPLELVDLAFSLQARIAR